LFSQEQKDRKTKGQLYDIIVKTRIC